MRFADNFLKKEKKNTDQLCNKQSALPVVYWHLIHLLGNLTLL